LPIPLRLLLTASESLLLETATTREQLMSFDRTYKDSRILVTGGAGQRCAETLFFDYWRQHALPIKVARADGLKETIACFRR
jgi:hypothetical protein